MKIIISIVFLLICFFGVTRIYAQDIEVKINPLFIPLNTLQLNVEYLLGKRFGLEPGVLYSPTQKGNKSAYLIGKYYLIPSLKGHDRLYAGIFGSHHFGTNDANVLGFYLGYKYLYLKALSFEAGIGNGLDITDGIPLKNFGVYHQFFLGIGYRFDIKKDKENIIN